MPNSLIVTGFENTTIQLYNKMQKGIFGRIFKNPALASLAIFVSFFITSKTAFALEYSNNSLSQNIIFFAKEDRIQRAKLTIKFKDNYVKGPEHYNENHANFRLDTNLKINDNFSAKAVLKFKELRSGTRNNIGSHNRSFENEGGFVEELTLNYDLEKFSLMSGKFVLDFADGWNQSGIWGQEQAVNNYRFSKKIGAATFFKTGDKKTNGQYVFGLSTFFNDRKYLANSIITDRDVPSKSDATPGDAGGVGASYNGSLNILFDFGNKEELTYHFSYLNLAVNKRASQLPQGRIADQKGFATNLNYKYPYSENVLIKTFGEFVTFQNYRGDKNKSADFFTANLSVDLYQNWGLTLSRNIGKSMQTGVSSTVSKITEFSGGYQFSKSSALNGLQVSVGYKENTVNDKVNKSNISTIGFLARYVKLF